MRGGESGADKKGKPIKECVIRKAVIGVGLDSPRPSELGTEHFQNHPSGKPGASVQRLLPPIDYGFPPGVETLPRVSTALAHRGRGTAEYLLLGEVSGAENWRET